MGTMARILVFTAFLLLALAVSTYSQDFLSIDCGVDEGYTDELGIEWVTDEDFIQTGKNVQLRGVKDPLTTLRYFPEGRSKNCYVLPVKNETTYLLRIQIYIDNDTAGVEFPVDFDVNVDNFLLRRFSAQSASDFRGGLVIEEAVFHTFNRSEIFVCLLKGTEGFPFVNSIELRELPSTAYSLEVVKNGRILYSFVRSNTGTRLEDQSIVRYPDDPYDRFWTPFPAENITRFERPAGNLSVPSRSNASDYNFPPEKVLLDAWVNFTGLQIGFRGLSGPVRTYFAFYFEEIRTNLTGPAGSTLPLIVGVNDELYTTNISTRIPEQRSLIATTDSNFTVTVAILTGVSRTAYLNAFEVLYSFEVDSSATSSIDSNGLKALQTSFELQDWTGDPCYPIAWDWLTCDTNTSRVVTLDLSNMTLSGSIPEEIGTLTELTEIRLNNNNLTGSIPLSMENLTKLELLVLDNNNLSGQIPASFQNRTGFTFAGNPGLCPGGPNCVSAPSPSPPARSAAVEPASVGMRRKILVGLIVAGTVALLT